MLFGIILLSIVFAGIYTSIMIGFYRANYNRGYSDGFKDCHNKIVNIKEKVLYREIN